MSKKLAVSITNAANDLDRATVGFVVANAAVASGQETVVFLSIEGVRLAVKGYTDGLHEEGFAPLGELLNQFVEAGGTIWICSPCFNKRDLDPDQIVEGSTIVGGATLVEFLSQGAACITY